MIIGALGMLPGKRRSFVGFKMDRETSAVGRLVSRGGKLA
jgi:hypothetical protein